MISRHALVCLGIGAERRLPIVDLVGGARGEDDAI
jgi:hypothetical protein